ncbi:MAG: tetraacyldisaccharide 4'-kinase [Marinilabiliaceae bacterium]|jgi:tetraacyldisaccharide 4'-kinase|nr:tetraacyldisaccharide 4'-kinase [Marinilabiliaceae bacterium]
MVKGIFKYLLFPLTLLYGFVIRIRNFMYDTGLFKVHKLNFPVISVGNLAVGGTGKTPHIEYLAELLKKEFKVAVLSRGYKRKTRGFIIAGDNPTAALIGDEAAQVKKKFPGLIVAVDANRLNGINRLRSEYPDLDVILLDDAYQHRKINAGINILLTAYPNPFTKDFLMPSGRLREHRKNMRRADIILVSRSPLQLSAIDRRVMVSNIKLKSYQNLYFTSVLYKEPIPFNQDIDRPLCLSEIAKSNRSILLISGIADPGPLYSYLSIYSKNIVHLSFRDHHFFTAKDLEKIIKAYSGLPEDSRCVITTEKDAERLKEIDNIASYFDRNLYILPIGLSFLNDDTKEFNNLITSYVRKTKTNKLLSD